jgi:UDP-N-acetylmuramate-alanine ligase
LLDIYPASEKPIKGISSKKLDSEILKNHKNALHWNKDPMTGCKKIIIDFSVLITQGAGTISKLNKKIKKSGNKKNYSFVWREIF